MLAFRAAKNIGNMRAAEILNCGCELRVPAVATENDLSRRGKKRGAALRPAGEVGAKIIKGAEECASRIEDGKLSSRITLK